MSARKINGVLIQCLRGDIANQPGIDAVVNAANAQLTTGGGVAGAIHRAAGPELERECRPLAPIAPGQAVVSGAYKLPNRYVIHCLGPVYGQDSPAEVLLANCYRNALYLGEQKQISSIAFPAISTGVFGYPIEAAAQIAITTIVEQTSRLSSIKQIRLVLHDDKAQKLYSQILESFAIKQSNGLALFTDLYQLTMLQAYWREEMTNDAVFSLFVRRLPERRNFLLACGLDTVLDYLENLHFSNEDISFLASLGDFSQGFLNWLQDFRFTGDVYAVPEGTPIFANEPILEVVAPLPQAQLVETFVINQIQLQTMLASKAQRVVSAANNRPVIDFASRRIHGIDAAVKAARAFYIGGVAATSNVLAGKQFGVPVTGTMAHSYVQAHQDEAAAFKAFAQLYPHTVLLVDTYDTLAGVEKVIALAKALGNFSVKAVRLDSGDLVDLSKQVRQLLDQAGLQQIEIVVSGGLDEDKIAELIAHEAPIDSFGVGTSMGVSEDAPSLDIVYKLCEYAGKGRLKLSTGKPVLPGRKQVFRMVDGDRQTYDVIARADEKLSGQALLVPVMQSGDRLEAGYVELETIRKYAQTQVNQLEQSLRAIVPTQSPYSVEISAALSQFQQEVENEIVD